MKLIKKYWTVLIIAYAIFIFINPIICSLLLGFLFLYLSFLVIKAQISVIKNGVAAVGKIKSYRIGLKGSATPTIEFTSAKGVLITKEPIISSSTDLSKFRSYRNMIDKEILVLYNPTNPEEFSIEGNRTSNILIFAFLGIGGLIFVTISITSLLGYLKL